MNKMFVNVCYINLFQKNSTFLSLKIIVDTNWCYKWNIKSSPQRTQISTVTNAPFIQNSNRMAFSVDHLQKFSELILSISAVLNAIFKLFASQGCSDDKDSLDISSIFAVQFCFRCKISFHEKPSKSNLTVVWFCYTNHNSLLCIATNEILYRQQITSNVFFRGQRSLLSNDERFWNKRALVVCSFII